MSLISILLALLALGFLILAHEWGHFWVARRMGMAVERFSIGFGPVLWSRRRNGTEFCLSVIPLGGYVKIKGMDAEDKESFEASDSFNKKSLWARAAVLCAGVTMNVCVAFLIMPIVFMIGHNMPDASKMSTQFEQVMAGSPAAEAGFQAGDRALSVNGIEVTSWEAMSAAVQQGNGSPIQFVLSRAGQKLEKKVVPEFNQEMEKWTIGVQGATASVPMTIKRYALGEAIQKGCEENVKIIRSTFEVLRSLVRLQVSYKSLVGPVQLTSVLAKASGEGLGMFLHLIAFLSLNLAIFNILPIPVLDGGHLVFLALEGVLRRPVNLKIQMWIQQIGMTLLLALMALVTFQDVNRMWDVSHWLKKFWP